MIIENKKPKIVTVALIALAVIVVAFLFVYQQKRISDLGSQISSLSKKNSSGTQNASSKNPFLLEAVRKDISSNTKDLTGILMAKNQDSITIQADIVDLSGLANIPADNLQQSKDSWPKAKKQFIVKYNSKTEMPTILQYITIGSTVHVLTDESIYSGAELTATKIYVTKDLGSDGITRENFFQKISKINGKITEIGGNYGIVSVAWLDLSKIKEGEKIDPETAPKINKSYKVVVDKNTVFAEKGWDSFKAGDFVIAYSASPVFSVLEFTATRIEGPIQPPTR